MTRNEKVSLSGDEVCNIIEACALYRVTKFKFKELQISFEPEKSHIKKGAPISKKLLEEQELTKVEAFEKMRMNLREDAITELMVNDPAAFEDEVVKGMDSELEAHGS